MLDRRNEPKLRRQMTLFVVVFVLHYSLGSVLET